MDLLRTRRKMDAGNTIFDLQLRVVYYARVSTDRDEQLNSLDNQITYYDDFIKSNRNWTFCGGYVDEGISGTSVEKRESFLRMIEDAANDKFDLIITKEISRFSRSTLDSIKYTQDLLDHGVGVYFQSDNINTLYTDAELRLTIMSSLAQDEMRRLSERVKFGMKRSYEAGKVLGRDNIYGYNKVNCKLEINEEEVRFVRELFDLYASGKYGYRTVARLLTEKGYRNQSGGEINPGTLKNILTNPKYKGYYHGRLTESNDYRRKKSVKLPQKEQILYKDESIPVIIEENLWNKVNTIITHRSEKFKKQSGGTQNRFPYSGKILCEEHGTHYYRKMWKDRKIPAEGWCCKEYLAKGRVSCKSPHLYTKDLDEILKKIGVELLCNKEKQQKAIEDLIDTYSASNIDIVALHNETNKTISLINKIASKKEKILDLYTDSEMTKEDYIKTNGNLNEQLKVLEKKKEDLINSQYANDGIVEKLKDVKCKISQLDETKAPIAVAQELLESILVLKESTPDVTYIRIKMKFGELEWEHKSTPIILYSDTEVSPIVGTERQSEELIHYLLNEFDDDPVKIWQSNIFGKSLNELVNEGLHNKLDRMPEEAQLKLQETLQKIINEGSGGLICIIL